MKILTKEAKLCWLRRLKDFSFNYPINLKLDANSCFQPSYNFISSILKQSGKKTTVNFQIICSSKQNTLEKYVCLYQGYFNQQWTDTNWKILFFTSCSVFSTRHWWMWISESTISTTGMLSVSSELENVRMWYNN